MAFAYMTLSLTSAVPASDHKKPATKRIWKGSIMIKRVLFLATSIVLLAASWTVGQTVKDANALKVAAVDIQKCMAADPFVAEREKEMRLIIAEKEKAFNQKTAAMKNDEKLREAQSFRQAVEVERLRLSKTIGERLRAKVKEIAAGEGYAVVLDSRYVLYGGTDITDKIIEGLKK